MHVAVSRWSRDYHPQPYWETVQGAWDGSGVSRSGISELEVAYAAGAAENGWCECYHSAIGMLTPVEYETLWTRQSVA